MSLCPPVTRVRYRHGYVLLLAGPLNFRVFRCETFLRMILESIGRVRSNFRGQVCRLDESFHHYLGNGPEQIS